MPQSTTLETSHGGIAGYVHVVASPRVREGYSTRRCDVLGAYKHVNLFSKR